MTNCTKIGCLLTWTIILILLYFLCRVYLKCLPRLQDWVLRIKTKKKIHTNLRPEMSVYILIEKLKKKELRKFYSHLTYIYSTSSEFNNSRDPNVCHFTVHYRYSKLPPPKSTHAWTLLIPECRTLSKVQGRLWMVWLASKMHRWSASSFSVFVPTHKNEGYWRHTLLDRTSRTKCLQRLAKTGYFPIASIAGRSINNIR
jgi:hypothetical protein